MFPIFFLFQYRQISSHSTATDFETHSSFGLLPNGTANFTFELPSPPSDSIPIIVHLFSHSDYLSFDLDSNVYDNYCRATVFNSPWNFTLSFNPLNASYIHIETSSDETVIFPVIFHCGHATFSEYKLTITYDNIRTRLDYRELPNLIIIPILSGLWFLTILFWFIFYLLKRHRFGSLSRALLSLGLLFLAVMLLTIASYKHADVSDDPNGWTITAIVFAAFFWACLFIFLTVAASGWGAIVTVLTPLNFLRTVLSSLSLFASITVLSYVDLGLWSLLLIVAIAVCCYLLFRDLRANTQFAQTEVKAHLLVIANQGFDPTTTPVYAKYMRYVAFLGLTVAAALALGILMLILAFVSAPQWIELLLLYVFAMAILAIIAFLYRPRGENVDRYWEKDEAEEGGGDRQAIQLEDLSGFEVGSAANRSGLREWDGETELPLQPVLIRTGRIEGVVVEDGKTPPAYLQSLIIRNDY